MVDVTKLIEYIDTLSRDPLAAIILAVHYSTHTASCYGRGIVGPDKEPEIPAEECGEYRGEVETCYSEAIMRLGPKLVGDTLNKEDGVEEYVDTLTHPHFTIHQSYDVY